MLINMGRLLRQTALRFSDRTALINVERNRRFTFYQLHELTNKMCNLIKDKFSLKEGDIYAVLLENDNMGLFHFWMTKSPATALWLDIRESVEEQLTRIDYANPRLIFIETKLLTQYYKHLHGRKISIVSGGYNIYSTEVENCINRHPAVQSCAVVGITDEQWGEAVCGVVVLKKGEIVQQQELIDHCKQHLARYKAPKRIYFVDELPLSSVGKVLRREVKKKFWVEEERGVH